MDPLPGRVALPLDVRGMESCVRQGLFRFGLGLSRLAEGIAAVLLFSIVVFNFLQVIFRYVVNSPLGWTEEVMRYSVAWVTYLGAVAALFRGEHMAVDALIMVVPPRIAAVLYRIVLGCGAVFCLILVWWGFPVAIRNAAQVSPSSQISMIWPYISVAVGGLLMLIVIVCLFPFPPGAVAGKLKDEAAS